MIHFNFQSKEWQVQFTKKILEIFSASYVLLGEEMFSLSPELDLLNQAAFTSVPWMTGSLRAGARHGFCIIN
jgi:hypothetical protein